MRREAAIPIPRVPAAVEKLTGHRPGTSTVWRWVLRGSGGAKLDSFLVGGRRFVTPDALERFLSRRSKDEAPPTRTPRQRQRAIEAAERELADAGI